MLQLNLRKAALSTAAIGLSAILVSCGGSGHDHNHKHDSEHKHSHDSATTHKEKDHKPHWSYEGETGPEKWGQLCTSFSDCNGKKQSPIDLKGAEFEEGLGELAIMYKNTSTLKAINNGHTVQVNLDAENSFEVDGGAFSLKQFHFHCPSEHTIDGNSYPMEAHLVHISDSGKIAVIGVMFEQGEENAFLANILSALPTEANKEVSDSTISYDVNTFLPEDKSYYRYAGSLTTPPCSEGVIWTVLKTSVTASAEQIEAFEQMMPTNNRPIQPLNDRAITTSVQ